MLYSGTVSAAREGSINNIKSIAFSVDRANNNYINWSTVKFFAPKIINKLLKIKIGNETFFNVNFPSLSYKLVKGIKIVNLGYRKPGSILITKNTKSDIKCKIPSDREIIKNTKKGEDEYEFRKNFITISLHNYKNLILSDNVMKKYRSEIGNLIEK